MLAPCDKQLFEDVMDAVRSNADAPPEEGGGGPSTALLIFERGLPS